MKVSALDIANLYISLANNLEEEIDNLKLNKLCYYAQAWFLTKFNKPLFKDKIEAWMHGPVIPSVYRAYKVCGSSPIKESVNDFDESKLDSDTLSLLIDVYMTYGKYTSSALRNKTHEQGSPWSQVYVEGKNSEITNKVMEEYFRDSDELETLQLNITPDKVISYVE